ncbi:hypothetical protein AKJ50_01955, partial [candidate division MSBL1 archaeon SCGC-AAA382A13]
TIVDDPKDIDQGIAVVSETSDMNHNKILVLQNGANSQGLKEIESDNGLSDAKSVIVFGDKIKSIPEVKKIIHFTSRKNEITESSDLVIPIRSWLEKKGTMINLTLSD